MRATVQTTEIRDSILDATDKLLARYGYQKMTIDDIAGEVGIGKGSIYLHFKSKEEIVLSHVDRIIDRLCDRLAAIARSNKPHIEKLRLMALERVSFRFDSVQHYTESINELLTSIRAKLLSRRKDHHRREAEIFALVIKDGQRKSELGAGKPIDLAKGFIIATNALLPFGLSTEELGRRKDVEANASKVIELLLNGIIKR